MSFVKINVHAVWGTKNRTMVLTDELLDLLIKHIKENSKKKEMYIDRINGYKDHIHCLFGLNVDMTTGKAIQLIKGESSHWINSEKITPYKFEWADEYYAISVSESLMYKVRKYIDEQKAHHAKMSFEQEWQAFMKLISGANQGKIPNDADQG
jgi:putative transposase